jgi:tetratricopeptide (TPR) repeat protein
VTAAEPTASSTAKPADSGNPAGCSYTGCFAGIALTAIGYWLLDSLDALLSRWLINPASVDVAFDELAEVFGQLVFRGGFAALITLALIGAAWERARRLGALLTLPILALGAWSIHESLFSRFVALRTRDGLLTLVYRFPRPAVVLASNQVRSLEVEKVPSPGEMTGWYYRLRLTSGARGSESVHVSERTPHRDRVERARRLAIREKWAGEARSASAALDRGRELEARGKLAYALIQLDDFDQAAKISRETLSLAQQHGEPLGIASASFALGVLAHQGGRHAEAEEHYARCLRLWRKHLDSDHPDLDDIEDAYRALLQETGRDADTLLGPRTPRTLVSELRRQGLTKEEAEAQVRELIRSRRN